MFFKVLETSIGTRVKATKRETKRGKITERDNSFPIILILPCTKRKGKKTITVVRVAAITDLDTSLLPTSAAVIGVLPFS